MRFVYPWMLGGLFMLPLVAVGAYWLLRVSRDRLAGFVSAQMRERMIGSASEALVVWQLVLMTAGLALLCLAAARPQWGRAVRKTESRGRNLVIALDVSRSMLAADVHPNRLERAKADLLDLLDELRGDRAGLLAFRGKANMICPLTSDRAFLRQALDGITIDSAPAGETDIAEAIVKSLEALDSAYDQNNAILLLTDGEDLAERAVRMAQRAAQRGVPIFTVGIGDPKGTPLPSPDGKGYLTYQGETVISRLDEATLRQIARISGGAYVPLATAGTASTTLGAIYRRHLAQVATREYAEQLERRYIERYQWFLIPALGMLLGMAFFSRGRLVPARRGRAVTVDSSSGQ